MGDVIAFIGNMLMQILDIELPFGITFGTMLIGTAFFCILIVVLKTIFTSIGTGVGGIKRKDFDD